MAWLLLRVQTVYKCAVSLHMKGYFCRCKISYKWPQAPQQKFLYFNFRMRLHIATPPRTTHTQVSSNSRSFG